MRHALPAVALALAIGVACGGGVTPTPSPGQVVESPPAPSATEAPPAAPALEKPTVPTPALPDAVTAFQNLPPVCRAGWCWRYPNTQGNRITRVWARSADDFWMLGLRGLALHWNGTEWQSRDFPESPYGGLPEINQLNGTSPDDVWAAGGNLLYHWDGKSWTLKESFGLEVDQRFGQIWISPKGDVWVCGNYGIFWRSKGGTGPFEIVIAATSMSGSVGPIWGTDEDFFTPASPYFLLRYDGTKFNETKLTPIAKIRDFWGTKSDLWMSATVFEGKQRGAMFHWDGQKLDFIDPGVNHDATIIGARNPKDIWFLGASLTDQIHWNGTEMEHVANPFAAAGGTLNPKGAALVGERLWVPTDQAAMYVHEVGTGWRQIVTPTRTKASSVWGRASDDLWTAGSAGIQHWDGKAWKQENLPGSPAGVHGMTGAWDPDHFDIWVAGGGATAAGFVGTITHFDGTSWSHKTFPGRHFNGIWSPGIGQTFAVGVGGKVDRLEDGVWSTLDTGTTLELFGVWGPSKDLAWIVGEQGKIWKWERANPNTLVPVASPTTSSLRAIHGFGQTAWVVAGQEILKYDGQNFVLLTVPNADNLESVFARSPTQVYLGGGHGQILRFDGVATFVPEAALVADDGITGLWAPPVGNLWATTGKGALERTGQ